MGKGLPIFFFLLFTFAFFQQGGGFNQNATLAEIRSFVEEGHFWIDPYTQITQDISLVNNHYYSNKTPSVFFFAAPAYAVFYWVARGIGIEVHALRFQFFATHLLTLLCAGIWGALLGVLLNLLIKEFYPSISELHRLLLSVGMPLGSLIFPYSTVAFLHVFEALWLGLSYYLWMKFDETSHTKYLFWMGLSFTSSVLANPILAALGPIYFVLILQRRFSLLPIMKFVAGMLVLLIPLLVYQQINFGAFWSTNRAFQNPAFVNPDALFGVFVHPNLTRLETLFLRGNRSLFPTQIYLLLAFPGMYFIFKEKTLLHLKRWLPLFATFLLYVGFILCFEAWHGGWAYGPRYFIGALVPMFLMSLPLFERFPRLYLLALGGSYLMMLVVTSVEMMPSAITGNLSFEKQLLTHFWEQKFEIEAGWPAFLSNVRPTSYKYLLGEVFGIGKMASLALLLGIQSVYMSWLIYLTQRSVDITQKIVEVDADARCEG